ncbi:hypothetical protein [Sphingopyxis sp. 22461]|uniref:hypothetical protein n=1 Tax=Sphingopyxis sp. 22461 TaxID=3453923 RepID=UPI003F847190
MDAYRDDWQALLDNVIEDRDAWEAKFKLAATDLAKQAEEIAGLKDAAHREGVRYNQLASDRNNWREQALRDEQPANMWRNSLKRSRHRKKGVRS